jgi:hypothetical protein
MDHVSKDQAVELLKNYSVFEKKHGSRVGIEDVVLNKRKLQYQEVKEEYMQFNFSLIQEFFPHSFIPK